MRWKLAQDEFTQTLVCLFISSSVYHPSSIHPGSVKGTCVHRAEKVEPHGSDPGSAWVRGNLTGVSLCRCAEGAVKGEQVWGVHATSDVIRPSVMSSRLCASPDEGQSVPEVVGQRCQRGVGGRPLRLQDQVRPAGVATATAWSLVRCMPCVSASSVCMLLPDWPRQPGRGPIGGLGVRGHTGSSGGRGGRSRSAEERIGGGGRGGSGRDVQVSQRPIRWPHVCPPPPCCCAPPPAPPPG